MQSIEAPHCTVCPLLCEKVGGTTASEPVAAVLLAISETLEAFQTFTTKEGSGDLDTQYYYLPYSTLMHM